MIDISTATGSDNTTAPVQYRRRKLICPEALRKRFIGSKGTNLLQLRRESGARIDLDLESGEITIEAKNPFSRQKAEDLIRRRGWLGDPPVR